MIQYADKLARLGYMSIPIRTSFDFEKATPENSETLVCKNGGSKDNVLWSCVSCVASSAQVNTGHKVYR